MATPTRTDESPVLRPITSGDPESRSADIVAENAQQLRALFPEAFTEDGIDFDVLKQLLAGAVAEGDEKYGLNWHGKRQARQIALTPSTGTLLPRPEESVDWDTTKNIVIEGDNLEVLKLLQKSYAGKVKLIYIDPPYNTGKDFVYKDSYRDNLTHYLTLTGQVDEEGRALSSNSEASGRFHSDWLNMIYPRIKLARSLMAEDGLLFASIDQVELADLRLICDEIFGEENFMAVLVRRAMHTVRNTAKDFNLHADYVLVYAKQKSWFAAEKSRYIRQLVDKTDSYPLDDADGRGPYKLDPLYARNFYTPYRHTFANGLTWEAPEGSYPRYAESTLDEMEADGRIRFGPGEFKAKRYLSEVQDGQPPNTILAPEDVGFNFDGTRELAETLGSDKVFSQPKPTRLITWILDLVRDPNCLVLDFFAGSGTTGHAVYKANLEDGGQRRFLLVQLPEPLDSANTDQRTAAEFCARVGCPMNIAEITKQRLRRASAALRNTGSDYTGDLGVRVFKLAPSNFSIWKPEGEKLTESLLTSVTHLRSDSSERDLLYELILKRGLDLVTPIESRVIAGITVYAIGGGALLTCLAEHFTGGNVESVASGIADWYAELAPVGETQVVVRDSAFPDDVAKTNFVVILQQHGLENVRSI